MKIVEFEQPEKMMELYFVGDVHYPRGIRSKFLEVLKQIEDNPNAYAIGMGDFCENITAGDPRYNPEEMADIIMKHGAPLNMVDAQWKMFEEDIKPLAKKKKILGLLMGNHGSSFTRRNSYNALKGICDRNDIKYLGDGMAVFDISYKGKHTYIQVFHGSGGGTTVGFAYKRLSDYSNIISDVDVVAAGHCFDEETELLTKDGWKKHDEISVGDVALTYNLKTDNSEWNNIEDISHYTHYKKMIHFKNRCMDLMVTPDHSIVSCWRRSDVPFKRLIAKEYMNKEMEMPNGGKNVNKEYKKYSDDELRLIAWVITEGSYESRLYIRISQSNKPKVGMKRIEGLCKNLKLDYSIHEATFNKKLNYDAYRLSLKSKNKFNAMVIKEFPDKQLTNELFSLSERQFKLFFEELILGDGIKYGKRMYQYCTKHEKEADILQSLCAYNGYRSSKIVRYDKRWGGCTTYTISINTRGITSITKGTGKYVDYDGVAWCPTVKNETVVVRRKGKVIVSGNSHRLGVNISIRPLKLQDGKLKQRIQYHCSTGSFLGNYEEDTTSYAERKAYPPLPIGYVRLEIYKGKVVPDSVVPVPV